MKRLTSVLVATVVAMTALVGVRATPASAAMPSDAAAAFVEAVHTDLLDRPPTTSEIAALEGAPLDTPAARAAVATTIVDSSEWIEQAVGMLYDEILGRPADAGGLAFWSARVDSGTASLAQVKASLAASTERFSLFALGDARTWVTGLYSSVLGRDGSADPEGVAYWVDRTGSVGPVAVAEALVRSEESRRRLVGLAYVDLLARAPDAGGLDFWSGHLAGHDTRSLDVGLVSGDEYLARAVERFGADADEPDTPPPPPDEATPPPGQPGHADAVPRPGAVTVSWSPPGPETGGPVVGYRVRDADGSLGCETTTATSCTVTGLDRGHAYRFTVTAHNASGEGPASTPTRTVVPDQSLPGVGADSYAGVVRVWWDFDNDWFPGPETPTAVRITVRQGSAVVRSQDIDILASWKGPLPVQPPWTLPFPSNWGDTVTGLTNGVAYTFTVTVVYGGRTGTESPPTAPVVPVPAPEPAAPFDVVATAGDGSASVTWDTTWVDGQAPVLGFRVLKLVGDVEVARQYLGILDVLDPSDPTNVRATIGGLTNGTPYRFVVITVTTAGDGPPSSPSNEVTPTG